MKAIILAAGQGTRLRPYTDDKPKCMVPLRGRPLLSWQLDVLKRVGITDITIIGGYCVEKLSYFGVDIAINPQYETTNMVSTLFCGRDRMIPGEDLVICYGDIIFELPVLQTVMDCKAPICLAADREWKKYWEMRMDDPFLDAETFRMDTQGDVITLGKKPSSIENIEAQYIGLFKVRGDQIVSFLAAYDAMDQHATYDGKDFDTMYMTSFIQYLIDTGWPVHACLISNGWLEVDTSDDLEIYESLEKEGRLSVFYRFMEF